MKRTPLLIRCPHCQGLTVAFEVLDLREANRVLKDQLARSRAARLDDRLRHFQRLRQAQRVHEAGGK